MRSPCWAFFRLLSEASAAEAALRATSSTAWFISSMDLAEAVTSSRCLAALCVALRTWAASSSVAFRKAVTTDSTCCARSRMILRPRSDFCLAAMASSAALAAFSAWEALSRLFTSLSSIMALSFTTMLCRALAREPVSSRLLISKVPEKSPPATASAKLVAWRMGVDKARATTRPITSSTRPTPMPAMAK